MLDVVRKTVRRHALIAKNECVLCACSGGPDSVALTASLCALRRELGIELCVAHIDHGLRPGSEKDFDLVRAVCAELGAVATSRRIVVPDGSGGLQERARTARYAALEQLATLHGCAKIAVGHTKSDQAETVLHRILRGTGLEGAAAIPVRRGRIVRPLLDVSRREILAFLAARGLPFVRDPSNDRGPFLRTRIRHELLPSLDALTPGVEDRLAALAADVCAAMEVLRPRLVSYADPSVARILEAPEELRSFVVRELLRRLRGDLRGLGRVHVQAAVDLVAKGPARGEIHLPGGRLRREGDHLRWINGSKRRCPS